MAVKPIRQNRLRERERLDHRGAAVGGGVEPDRKLHGLIYKSTGAIVDLLRPVLNPRGVRRDLRDWDKFPAREVSPECRPHVRAIADYSDVEVVADSLVLCALD